MRIIHLGLGKANPNRMNGVNKVIFQLASNQLHWCKNVSFWGITPNPKEPTVDRPFESRFFQYHKNSHKIDGELVKAIEACEKATVFHLHGAFIPEYVPLTKLLRNQGLPYVYTPHGSFNKASLQKNKWMKVAYLNLAERGILKGAKAVQFLGDSEFNDIDSYINLNNKVLIPNGQKRDLPRLKIVEAKKEHPVFGFCGRLDISHKGLDLMLDGFASYLKKANNAVLWLIGDGKDRKTLEAQCRNLGISDKVVFHGAQFGDDKFKLLNQLDYFLHTSRYEGLPTAVLEAAALEIPCIVSPATNMCRYISDYNAGISIDDNSVSKITQAFEKADAQWQNNECLKLGQNAFKMVENEFDWVKIGKRLIDVYAA